MIALVAGLNFLTQGERYALPPFPCQILCSNLMGWMEVYGDPASYIFGSTTEPGFFADGGFLCSTDANASVIIKKHTLGKSGESSNYSATVIQDKPSYYWRLNETFGAAVDRMQGLNGTISGGVTLNQPGALVDGDKCMVFDGVSGKIVTSTAGIIPLICTIEAWIKTTDADPQPIISFGATFGLLPTIGTQSGSLWVAYDSANAFSNKTVTDGQWHHVVYVLSSTTCSFYIDGVLDVTRSQVRSAATTDIITIGAGVAPTVPWNGSIDEVAIYPYALTPAQIQSHYKARSPYPTDSYATKVIASGPSAYWRLDETYGTVAKDVIGGANGTIASGVTLNQSGALSDGNAAMKFNGGSYPNDRISVPSAAYNAVGTGPFTQEIWFRTTTASGRTYLVDSGGSGTNGWVVLLEDTNKIYCWLTSPGSPIYPVFSGLPVFNDDKWHHVVTVVVRGASDVLWLYLDGVGYSQTLTQTGNNYTGGILSIGSQRDAATSARCSIDEVAIYPRALTPAEILDHYRAR